MSRRKECNHTDAGRISLFATNYAVLFILSILKMRHVSEGAPFEVAMFERTLASTAPNVTYVRYAGLTASRARSADMSFGPNQS